MDPKTTTEGGNQSELDREEAALRDEAMKIDPPTAADRQIPEEPIEPDEDATSSASTAADEVAKKNAADLKAAKDKASKESAAKAEADKKAAADKAATDKKAAEDKAKLEADEDAKKKAEQANLSPYQKERTRLNESWKKLEADKEKTRAEAEQLRKDREALEADRKKLADDRQRSATKREKPKDATGYTADELEAAAADFEKDGKLELRDIAAAKAKALRKLEAEQNAGGGGGDTGADSYPVPSEAQQQRMLREWNGHLVKLSEENPDMKVMDSPLRTEVTALLKQFPIFHTRSEGIHYAVEVAKLRLSEKEAKAKATELSTRITELETENKRLTELTALHPAGGGSGSHSSPKKFENMTDAEQEEYLKREAAEAST